MFVSRKGSDTCIAIINKCGNTSIRGAVTNALEPLEFSNEEALNYRRRVAYVRDPIQRFHSGFNHFWGTTIIDKPFGDMPIEHIYVEGRGLQGDFEAYTDYTFKHPNEHWDNQSAMIKHGGMLVPNIFHMLEDIQKTWENYFTGVLPWDHAWTKQKVEPYRLAELKEKYHDDYVMLESVKRG